MGLYPPPTQQEAVTLVSAVHCFLMTAKLTSPSNNYNWNLCALAFVHFAVFSWHANFSHLAKKKNTKQKLQKNYHHPMNVTEICAPSLLNITTVFSWHANFFHLAKKK